MVRDDLDLKGCIDWLKENLEQFDAMGIPKLLQKEIHKIFSLLMEEEG